MRIGLEREYLLDNCIATIHDVLALAEQYLVPGMEKEFFTYMVEFTTEALSTPELAVAQLRARVEALTPNVDFGQYASFANRSPPAAFTDVTGTSDYYRWVYTDACRRAGVHPSELHHVGVHISYSAEEEGATDEQLLHATNWLRSMTWLFTLLTSNSPFKDGMSNGTLSHRSLDYPNRYDVPLWASMAELRQWIATEESAYRIYPGKARAWMTVAPRFIGNNFHAPLERVELRALDSGTGVSWELLEGCCVLGWRIIQHALTGAPLPVETPEQTKMNDQLTARFGRNAVVQLNGHSQNAERLARSWVAGIPALEHVLDTGTPAELALRNGIIVGH